MAFDVYVGTMSRFYRQDWENAGQRFARENGLRYNVIQVGGSSEPPLSAEETRRAVEIWRGGLSEALKPHGVAPLDWSETDDRPYFTERPTWDGYAALVTWAAYGDHRNMIPPETVPEVYQTDPAYQKSTAPGAKSEYPAITAAHLWLPVDFPIVFEAGALSVENDHVASTFELRRELDWLAEQTRKQLENPAAARPGFFAKLLKQKPPPSDPKRPNLIETVKQMLPLFRDLAEKACVHRLPILLSY